MILGNNKKNKDIDDYEYNNSNGRKSISNVIDNFNNMGVSKYIPVLVMIFFIVLIIFYAFYSKNKDEFKSIKINSSKEIVYTIYNKSPNSQQEVNVPYINVNNDNIKKVNKEIINLSEDFLNKDSNNIIGYQYSVTGKFLSLALKMIDYSGDVDVIKFKTYNINLKTFEVMNNKDILSLYEINNKDVVNRLNNKFKSFYNSEVKQGYIESRECNYNCFLEIRGISNMIDDASYFIQDGRLYAYKEFSIDSIYNDYEFYSDFDFLFYITG